MDSKEIKHIADNTLFLKKIEKTVNSLDCIYRPSWDNYFMAITYLVSARSSSKRLKVGAVIVKDNRIISTGYNGFLPSIPHISIMREGHEQNTIHAEQNAISDVAKRGSNTSGATIYITHSPCIHCSKYIIACGIKKVVYANDYRNDELVLKIMGQAEVVMYKLQ